jgi:hypothetical protein
MATIGGHHPFESGEILELLGFGGFVLLVGKRLDIGF